MPTYLGESGGARVLQTGVGLTQAGTTHQIDLTTNPAMPMGEVGDVLFRSIDVAGTTVGGYAIGITPIVDGVSEPEQTFTSSATGQFQCQAFFAARGTSIAARVRTTATVGTVTVTNIAVSLVPIRMTP